MWYAVHEERGKERESQVIMSSSSLISFLSLFSSVSCHSAFSERLKIPQLPIIMHYSSFFSYWHKTHQRNSSRSSILIALLSDIAYTTGIPSLSHSQHSQIGKVMFLTLNSNSVKKTSATAAAVHNILYSPLRIYISFNFLSVFLCILITQTIPLMPKLFCGICKFFPLFFLFIFFDVWWCMYVLW